MRNSMKKLCTVVTLVGGMTAVGAAQAQQSSAPAQSRDPNQSFTPIRLALEPAEPESVYAPWAPPREDEGINQGAVHFQLAVDYFTDYVYRGFELSELKSFNPAAATVPEDALNLQVATQLSWDLGKLPHPFFGVFVNFADSDPISSFQEIRPFFGFDWTIRPIVLSAGHNTYLYPDRDAFESSEVWGQVTLDDSFFFKTEKPIISPYIYGAYDYDRYNGWYFEAGLSHAFALEDTGLTFTLNANVAYIMGLELYSVRPNQQDVNGLQHYQIGLTADYSLNKLLNFPPRYGEWSLQGFINYTDGLDNDLNATTQMWGGGGIMFKY